MRVKQFFPGAYPLRGHVQHYDWGDPHSIPALTGKSNRDKRPWAEFWMGAHSDLPSDVLVDGQWISLAELIAKFPLTVLGDRVCISFSEALPFLFKILAAAQPLSIQVHPTKSAAEEGFKKENEMGVALDARHRNYKDVNHKPEIIAALTPFYGLRGFRPINEIRDQLSALPEFSFLLNEFEKDVSHSIRKLYGKLMSMDAGDVHERLAVVIQRLKERHFRQPFSRESAEYWVLQSNKCCSENGLHDRGLMSFFLLNLVSLLPGQAMYLPAGVLHAYLEGVGVELMANSNNVLRGGLTSKHVDVDELMQHVSFNPEKVDILTAKPLRGSNAVQKYSSGAAEFELNQIASGSGQLEVTLSSDGPEILFPTTMPANGSCRIKWEGGEIAMKQGSPLLICHDVRYTLQLDPGVRIFLALVPSKK